MPFSTLIMRTENSLDYWGNKIIYAVTFEQTDNTTFAGNNGAVIMDVVDDPVKVLDRIENGTLQDNSNDGVPEEKSDTIDFILFSTGSLAVGGFTKDGIVTTVCGNMTNGFESENCDFDNRFFYDVDPNLNRASAFSQVVGDTYYDDLTLVQESVPEGTWFQHPDNTIYLNDFIITQATKIAIGKVEPDALAMVDVVGNIRAEGGIQSDSICDTGVANCFDPELITGTMDAMKCDADNSLYGEQAVMRLANSKVSCSSAANNVGGAIEGEKVRVDTSVININSCGPGDLVSGIDLNGDIKCVTP